MPIKITVGTMNPISQIDKRLNRKRKNISENNVEIYIKIYNMQEKRYGEKIYKKKMHTERLHTQKYFNRIIIVSVRFVVYSLPNITHNMYNNSSNLIVCYVQATCVIICNMYEVYSIEHATAIFLLHTT